MIDSIFKKTICFSLLGHLAVFSLFSLSFGEKIPGIYYGGVYFWGSVLLNSELVVNKQTSVRLGAKETFRRKADTELLVRPTQDIPSLPNNYLKPQPMALWSQQEKIPARQKRSLTAYSRIKKEPSITLHPHLPYNFLLYFKNRQIVHIELMFNIISHGKTNSITIKRKIASGNLEADLLSMRYINHYLFVQQSRFMPNKWQVVKIELSAKND
jgi:hypothetical protein